MPIELKMPALSPTMEEGTLAKWLVKEGDAITSGMIMAEIETDKATMEFEAVDEGVLAQIIVEEGSENVAVGKVIALLAEEGEDAGSVSLDDAPDDKPSNDKDTADAPADPEPAKPGSDNAKVKTTPVARRLIEANGIDPSQIEGSGPGGKIIKADVEAAMAGGGAASVTGASSGKPKALQSARNKDRIIASPLARKLADDQGIGLENVMGTGPHGRIIKADIDAFDPASLPATQEPPAAEPKAASSPPPPASSGDLPFTEEKVSNVRKVIARRLTESKSTVPHYYLTIDIRLDALLALRKQLNAALEPDGVKLSVNDLLIKALAKALMRVPQCNVSYHGETMRRYERADISVAVAAPSGLITPVIQSANSKSLAEISSEMSALAAKAREGKLQPHEYQGGTASLSNLGMFGIKQFDAVINPPQGMILAVGAGQQMPAVVDGAVVPATILSASGSFDHRAIDGADGAQLMEAIKQLIEEPMGLVV